MYVHDNGMGARSRRRVDIGLDLELSNRLVGKSLHRRLSVLPCRLSGPRQTREEHTKYPISPTKTRQLTSFIERLSQGATL